MPLGPYNVQLSYLLNFNVSKIQKNIDWDGIWFKIVVKGFKIFTFLDIFEYLQIIANNLNQLYYEQHRAFPRKKMQRGIFEKCAVGAVNQ